LYLWFISKAPLLLIKNILPNKEVQNIDFKFYFALIKSKKQTFMETNKMNKYIESVKEDKRPREGFLAQIALFLLGILVRLSIKILIQAVSKISLSQLQKNF